MKNCLQHLLISLVSNATICYQLNVLNLQATAFPITITGLPHGNQLHEIQNKKNEIICLRTKQTQNKTAPGRCTKPTHQPAASARWSYGQTLHWLQPHLTLTVSWNKNFKKGEQMFVSLLSSKMQWLKFFSFAIVTHNKYPGVLFH